MEQLEILDWAMMAIAKAIQETEDENECADLQEKLRLLAKLHVREELK